MNSVLFQPFRLHDLTLPNRIVMSPMTRGRAGAARLPNRLMAEYYAQRCSAGLLITEAVTISEEANGWNECDLADAAMGFAYAATLAEGETFTTIELKINFLGAVRKATLTADARVVKAGSTLGYVECEVKDQTGKLVAKAASTCMKLRQDRKQP